ncbi:MAG: hypothetical protein WC343_12530 [Bacilli bacterium]|jgi:hypothetical protein
MTLHEQLLILNTFIKDKAGMPKLRIPEYNDLLIISNDSLFERTLKRLKAEAAELKIKESDYIARNEDLRPFKLTATISLTTGVGTLPSTLVYPIAVNGVYNTSLRNIEIISEEEKNYRIGNMVAPPIEDYPISIIDTSIRVWPTNVASIDLTYIKQPTKPVYITSVNATSGLNEYSGSSTEYEWNEHNHPDLFMEIINLLGISANTEDIKKYLQR